MKIIVDKSLDLDITRIDSTNFPNLKEVLITTPTGKIRIICDSVKELEIAESIFVQIAKCIADNRQKDSYTIC